MNTELITSFKALVWEKINNYPEQYVELFMYMAWEVWKRKNAVCFEKKEFKTWDIVRRAHQQWNEHVDSRGRMEVKEKPHPITSRWLPPTQGRLKINCDVAVRKNGKIGLGFVVRDDSGKIILAANKEETGEGSSTVLEGLAMRHAMQMAKQYQLKGCEVESDSKVLVDAVEERTTPPTYCDVLVHDIRSLAEDIGCVKFEFIPRQCNQFAHNAARGPEFISINFVPSHLLQYADADVRV